MFFFFFNDTATTEIYTLSLHDALPIYLVLLDIGLPKMDGYEVARHLKTKQQFGNTTIVMISKRDGVIDRLKGRLAGAKDYITKPFKTQEVMTIVHSHLSSPTIG